MPLAIRPLQKSKPPTVRPELVEEWRLQAIDCKQSVLRQAQHERVEIVQINTFVKVLQYKSLPLSQIKIDRSFVRDIAIDRDDEIIVQTIISMAHNLGLEVIAEGVETTVQLEFLRKNGCKVFQGFLFGKPTSQTEFDQLIQSGVSDEDRLPSIACSSLAL